jgi:hypothetical protein
VEDFGQANPDMDFRFTGDSGLSAGTIFNLSVKGRHELRFVATGVSTTDSAPSLAPVSASALSKREGGLGGKDLVPPEGAGV